MKEDKPKNKDEKNEKLLKKILGFVNASIEVNNSWSDVYKDGINYVFGNQLAGKDRKGWERICINEIFPSIAQEIAVISQRNCEVIAKPVEDSDIDASEIWQALLRYQRLNYINMPKLKRSALMDGKLFGNAFAKVSWNDKWKWNDAEHRWQGRPEAHLINFGMFGIDPDAESLESAEYVYTFRSVPVDYLKNEYPKFEKQIEDAVDGERPDPTDITSQIASSNAAATVRAERTHKDAGESYNNEGELANLIMDARTGYRGGGGHGGSGERPEYITLLEVFFRDREEVSKAEWDGIPLEELIASGAVTNSQQGIVKDPSQFEAKVKKGDLLTQTNWPMRKTREWREPKYPYGRHVLIAGRTVILNENEDEQRWELPSWPFVMFTNFELPHTHMGLNGVEMAKGSQQAVNVAASAIASNLKHFGHPITKVEKDALVKDPKNPNKKFVAEPGKVIELEPNKLGAIGYMEPPSMSQNVMVQLQTHSGMVKRIMGTPDVFQGFSASGSQTAEEVARLATASSMRSGLVATNLDEFDKKIMQIVLEFDRAYLTDEDSVRLLGDKQGRKMLSLRAVGDNFFNVEMDIELDVTSTLPYENERRKQEALQLYQILGPAYIDRVLDAYEVKNKDEILDKIAAWQQIQQIMTMQQEIEKSKGNENGKENGNGQPHPAAAVQ